MFTIERYHDFSYGHRVVGHESKCARLHGHNGRVTFTVKTTELDKLGRVLDFSEINKKLCNWVETMWDHSFLVWEKDPWKAKLLDLDINGCFIVPFNPTAENMAMYLVKEVGPTVLPSGVVLIKVKMEETRKCSATYEL